MDDTREAALRQALKNLADHFAAVMGGPMIAGAGVTFADGVEGIPTLKAARAALSASPPPSGDLEADNRELRAAIVEAGKQNDALGYARGLEDAAKVADMEYTTLTINDTGSMTGTGAARIDAAKGTAKGIAAAIRALARER